MNESLVTLNILGGVCLLLWGSYTVRMAVDKGYANTLSVLVKRAVHSRMHALVGGALAAVALQSATAAILLTTGMVATGLLPLVTAIAVILGADIGSALAVKVLYLNLSFLSPLLLCAGLFMHRLSTTWRYQQLGRILIGLGLILLSLQLLRQSIVPLLDSSTSSELLVVFESLPLLLLIGVALLTWAAHSSVAMVLIIASVADSGLLSAPLIVFAVVGANIGSGLIALFLDGRRHHDSRSAVFANFMMRSALGLVVLVCASWIEGYIGLIGSSAGAQVINAHLLFNLVLATVFLPLGAQVARVARWCTVARDPLVQQGIAPGASLDASIIDQPAQALSCARREAFRLADDAEALFANALRLFEVTDRSAIARLTAGEADINARNKALQHYLSEVRRHVDDPEQARMLDSILNFAACMENIGDLVSHDIARLAIKRLDRQVAFSPEGHAELHALHAQVLKTIRMDITHFTVDALQKRQAVENQIAAVMAEGRNSIARHQQRLSERHSRSFDTRSIHQDLVRDLLLVVRCIAERDLN